MKLTQLNVSTPNKEFFYAFFPNSTVRPDQGPARNCVIHTNSEIWKYCDRIPNIPRQTSKMLVFLICICARARVCLYTGYTQKNGAVPKINKKFISHLKRAQPTPSAATTVQVSHALIAVRFSCLLQGRGASFQDGVAAGKGFLCVLF